MIETTNITIEAHSSGEVRMTMPGHPIVGMTPDNAQRLGMQLVESARVIQERNGSAPATVIVKSSRVVEFPSIVCQASADAVYKALRRKTR